MDVRDNPLFGEFETNEEEWERKRGYCWGIPLPWTRWSELTAMERSIRIREWSLRIVIGIFIVLAFPCTFALFFIVYAAVNSHYLFVPFIITVAVCWIVVLIICGCITWLQRCTNRNKLKLQGMTIEDQRRMESRYEDVRTPSLEAAEPVFDNFEYE